MSEPFISVMELVSQEQGPSVHSAIRQEVLDMELTVKTHMDKGLSSDEMAVARSVREAVQAAEHIMEKVAAL